MNRFQQLEFALSILSQSSDEGKFAGLLLVSKVLNDFAENENNVKAEKQTMQHGIPSVPLKDEWMMSDDDEVDETDDDKMEKIEKLDRVVGLEKFLTDELREKIFKACSLDFLKRLLMNGGGNIEGVSQDVAVSVIASICENNKLMKELTVCVGAIKRHAMRTYDLLSLKYNLGRMKRFCLIACDQLHA